MEIFKNCLKLGFCKVGGYLTHYKEKIKQLSVRIMFVQHVEKKTLKTYVIENEIDYYSFQKFRNEKPFLYIGQLLCHS